MNHAYAPTRMRLLPGHSDVSLAVGCCGGGLRFRDLFRQTWRRIPLNPRRLIRDHWKLDLSCGGNGADIELLPGWTTRGELECACVDLCGHRVQFHGPSVAEMPDDVVQDLVAHELAHVVQFAQYTPIVESISLDVFATDDDEDEFIDALLGEVEADRMILQWGFNPGSFDEWELATGRAAIRSERCQACDDDDEAPAHRRWR